LFKNLSFYLMDTNMEKYEINLENMSKSKVESTTFKSTTFTALI